MGQAAIELPEPTEQSTPPSPASADDLLSQLAGEEVDRMLADADSSPGLASPMARAAEPISTTLDASPDSTIAMQEPASAALETAAVDLVGQIDTGASQATVENLEASTAAPVSVAADASVDANPPQQTAPGAEGAVQDQLDALFSELTGSDGSASVEAPAGTEPTPENQQQFDQMVAQAASETPAAAGGGAEVASLNAELVASLDSAGQSHDQLSKAPLVEHPAAGDAWYVALLEKLNAPFAAVSPELRTLLGKVAIVTAFNAAVILVYVLMFRR